LKHRAEEGGGAEEHKPADFFVGVIDFSVLLPGALLSAVHAREY